MKGLRKKGFTLLELLIVVVILAVLAGLALPQYLRTVARARESEGWTNLQAIRGAQFRYYAEFPGTGFTSNVTALDVDIPAGRYSYIMPGSGANFTATAQAIPAKCAGCRTLTVDNAGTTSAFQ